MGKHATERSELGLPGLVVLITEEVFRGFVHQVPVRVRIALSWLGGVEGSDPGRVSVVVEGAGHELAGGLGEPEGLARMPCQ